MEKTKSFYIDLPTRIITKIKIINTKIVNKSGFLSSQYILYIFKVITPFSNWYIKKRYSDIKEIFDFLVLQNPKIIFPPFPPKRFFSTKESTIIERKNGFEEFFNFILDNIDILKYINLINFFKIKRAILGIYIENCTLINEINYTYEIIDAIDSPSSSNDLSQNSDDSAKVKNKNNNIEIKQENKNRNNEKSINENTKKIFKINDNENQQNINSNSNKNISNLSKKNNINNINNIDNNNNINDKIIINNINEQVEKKNRKPSISSNGNYFRRYEDFTLAKNEFTHRSQVTFFIIKEFLRNLKVHSSHIFEIINDFTNYLKYKNKWKKLNDNEVKSLFIGINKDGLIEDYYQYIFPDEKPLLRMSTRFSEKTTLSSTPNSINMNSLSNININNSNNINIIEDEFINKNPEILEGLFYNIGNFEENYLGARSCLQLLKKLFESQFNPEVDRYINIFKKIDIKFIKKMNLCKFSTLNGCINQKICFEILNIYIGGYDEKQQIKILTELNANDSIIDKIFENKYKEDIFFNSYNLE